MMPVLLESRLDGLPPFGRGKVRDTYDLGDRLLIVATDRISAFDRVLPTGIPGKGAVLTQLSSFWFRQTGQIVPNHLIADQIADYPPELRRHAEALVGGRGPQLRGEPVGAEAEVDEPGAGDLGSLEHVAEVETADDLVGDVARLSAEYLGQRHGAIGLVVAELRVLGRLDQRRVRRRVRDQPGQGGGELLLEEGEEIH